MAVDLRRYDNPAAFRAAVWPFLIEREAEHNLLLGISGALVGEGYAAPSDPYLAALQEGGRVVLAAVLTPGHRIVLSEFDGDLPLGLIVDDLIEHGWAPSGVLAPTVHAHAFARRWCERTGGSYKLAARETIYQLRDVTLPDGIPGELRPFTPADRERSIEWVRGFYRDAIHEELAPDDAAVAVDRHLDSQPPSAFVWDHGGPRSMAVVGGATPHGIRVFGVYTPPEHRGRGYARACVGALSARMLAEGRQLCFLFADADYSTSNFVYRSLGYEPVTEVQEIDFVPPA